MTRLQTYSTKLVSSVLILAILAPGVAQAECYPAKTAPPDADCVVLPYNEQQGVWFPLAQADELRKLKLREPELNHQIDLYSGVTAALKLARLDYQKAYTAQAEATRQMEVTNKNLAAETVRAREAQRKAEAQRDAWYRSPFVWFGTGLVTAVAIGIGAAHATK